MKKLTVLFAALFMITFAAQNVIASDPQTATANAAANIITPMSITKNVDLSFGNIAAGTAAGTVVLGTNGTRTPNNVILPSVTGTVAASQFTVSGLADATYVITLPGSITITSGTNNMTVDNFTENATKTLTAGNETFNVGATLNVAAGQAVGLYQGSFNVTVDYQ